MNVYEGRIIETCFQRVRIHKKKKENEIFCNPKWPIHMNGIKTCFSGLQFIFFVFYFVSPQRKSLVFENILQFQFILLALQIYLYFIAEKEIQDKINDCQLKLRSVNKNQDIFF